MALVGVLGAAFLAIGLWEWRRYGKARGQEALRGGALALLVLGGFGVASWLISLVVVLVR